MDYPIHAPSAEKAGAKKQRPPASAIAYETALFYLPAERCGPRSPVGSAHIGKRYLFLYFSGGLLPMLGSSISAPCPANAKLKMTLGIIRFFWQCPESLQAAFGTPRTFSIACTIYSLGNAPTAIWGVLFVGMNNMDGILRMPKAAASSCSWPVFTL